MLQDFKTKSAIYNRSMKKMNGNNQHLAKMVVAIDCGYSAVKGITTDMGFIFPSFAKRVDGELEAIVRSDNFAYQLRNNLTGEYWIVGELADDMQNAADVARTTDESIYGRYRYNSPMYNALMSVGLGLALKDVDMAGSYKEIFLQCGLPSLYKQRDEGVLKAALAISYDFSLKIGADPWRDFKFTLDMNHVFVMEQPQGTLVSVGFGADRELGQSVLTSASIILDIGFGTEDVYSIKSKYADKHCTDTDTSMKAVFDKAIAKLSKDYPIDIKTFEMQKYLQLGKIPYYDEITESYECVPEDVFEKAIRDANRELCDVSIERLRKSYDNFKFHKYIIVTGGTGESRFEQIKESLADLSAKIGTQVLAGNLGDPELPFSFSNVLGYYIFRQKALAKENA